MLRSVLSAWRELLSARCAITRASKRLIQLVSRAPARSRERDNICGQAAADLEVRNSHRVSRGIGYDARVYTLYSEIVAER